jgi:hypothetical protein
MSSISSRIFRSSVRGAESRHGARPSRATAEILGSGGKHAEIPVFNAISDHLRKSILIVGDIIFNLSVAWDRIHTNCPANSPVFPRSARKCPARHETRLERIARPGSIQKQLNLSFYYQKTLELSSRKHPVRPESVPRAPSERA